TTVTRNKLSQPIKPIKPLNNIDIDRIIDIIHDTDFTKCNRNFDGNLKRRTDYGIFRPIQHKKIIQINMELKLFKYSERGSLVSDGEFVISQHETKEINHQSGANKSAFFKKIIYATEKAICPTLAKKTSDRVQEHKSLQIAITAHCSRATAKQAIPKAVNEVVRHIMLMRGNINEASIRSYNRRCSTLRQSQSTTPWRHLPREHLKSCLPYHSLAHIAATNSNCTTNICIYNI
ncbi:hypothetical protein MAR_031176, partial [Mya arenaria]